MRKFPELLAAGLLLLAVFGATVLAQDESLSELEERFEVMRLSSGYALRPRAELDDVHVIEVGRGRVAVDGDRVDRDELDELVGEDDAWRIFDLAEVEEARTVERLMEAAEERAELDQEMLRELEERIREQVERLERQNADRIDREELEVDVERMIEDFSRRADRHREGDRERRRRVHTDSRVSLGSGLTVRADESTSDVTAIGASIDVRGEVRGSAVAVLGSIDVQGEVTGDVVAVGGSVSLGPRARVGGEVSAIGGTIYRETGARVSGSEISMPIFDLDDIGWRHWWPERSGWGLMDGSWADMVSLALTGMLLLVQLLLLVMIARSTVERVTERAANDPWKSALVGLISQILCLPVLLILLTILAVSVVGIPLIPVPFIALWVAFLLGYAAVASALGRLIAARFDVAGAGPYIHLLLGVALVQGLRLVSEALTFIGGPFRVFVLLIIGLCVFFKYVVWTVGLGSVVLHFFSPVPAASEPPPPPAEAEDPPALPEPEPQSA